MKRPVVIVSLVSALLLLLAGIVAIIFFTVRYDWAPFVLQDASAKIEESKTLKVDTKKSVVLNISDDVGNVTVIGADVEDVQIAVTKIAYASTQAKADEQVKAIQYNIDQAGNTILIGFDANAIVNEYDTPFFNDRNVSNRVDFFITVPHKTIVDIDNNLGDVNLSEIQGDVEIELDFGVTAIKNVTGALSVKSHGGDIKAESIKANSAEIYLHSDFGDLQLIQSNATDVEITSNGGAILIREVRAAGKVVTKTDFGETTIQNGSANSLDVSTNGGNVNVEKMKVTGGLSVKDDFGEVNLIQASAASYDIKSNGGNINIDGAKGNVKAHTDFGNIAIQNAANATLDLKSNNGTILFSGSLGEGPHMIKSDFGGISLTLPADTKLDVELKTDLGAIESDLPIASITTGTSASETSHITGSINGGGSSLTATTNSGKISIKTLDK